MNAKDRRQLRRAEIRADEAERMLKHINQSHMDQFMTVYEDRCAMLQALELVNEAFGLLRDRVKDDPQYMAKRADVAPNF